MILKILSLSVIFSFLSCKSQLATLYVGTYTNGASEGIYKLDFNTTTGELTNKQLAIKTKNPSFITFSPNRKKLYAAGEAETSAVTAFNVNDNGTLTFLNSVSSNGKGPCHITINKAGNTVAVSNYAGGTGAVYAVNKNGTLNEASQVFNHNTENQKAHVHAAHFYNDDLFFADLGRNAVYNYSLTDNTYKLKSPAIIKTEGNPGPRHFVINKSGEFIYIINEYGNSITSVKRTDNGFEKIDEDSTLRSDFKAHNTSADIHLSKDERFLYGSNRGENSIAVFKRNIKTGTLEKIQNISSHGTIPRNFTLDTTGNFLLVANKKSENISVFKIDKTSGKLTFLHSIDLPSPVCLLF